MSLSILKMHAYNKVGQTLSELNACGLEGADTLGKSRK
jgi:hypothetical protein